MTEMLERPLMGVRLYTVDDAGYLGSLTGRGGRWEPDKPQRAMCENGVGPGTYRIRYGYTTSDGKIVEPETKHDVPDQNCGCGYYSYYSLEDSQNDYVIPNSHFVEDFVHAVVSAWGDVVLHETGYRSEYMMIEALIVGKSGYKHFGHWIDLMPAWEALAERYAVPLIDEEDVDEFCRERGEVVDSQDLIEERRQQMKVAVEAQFDQLNKSLKRIVDRMNSNALTFGGGGRRDGDMSWQEALERKRNQPAFWREAAGGDVHA